jgi:hypothetical protein
MDTSLEDRKITLVHIISYGVVTALIHIIAGLLYVYGGNLLDAERNLSYDDEYMRNMGLVIYQGIGFLSFTGTSFWIARKSRVRTLQINFSMLFFGFIATLLFDWLMGISILDFSMFGMYLFYTLLTWAVGVVLGSFTPRVLKGKRTHHENWDARKDREYHEKKRK